MEPFRRCIPDLQNAAGQHPAAQDSCRHYEKEKRSIIAPADAVAHPGAVVIEFVDAIVALRAVRAPRRAVVAASSAVLCGDRVAI